MDYELSDDPARVDVAAAWAFLSTEAYWARWRTRADFERQVAGAWRVVGCYDADGADGADGADRADRGGGGGGAGGRGGRRGRRGRRDGRLRPRVLRRRRPGLPRRRLRAAGAPRRGAG